MDQSPFKKTINACLFLLRVIFGGRERKDRLLSFKSLKYIVDNSHVSYERKSAREENYPFEKNDSASRFAIVFGKGKHPTADAAIDEEQVQPKEIDETEMRPGLESVLSDAAVDAVRAKDIRQLSPQDHDVRSPQELLEIIQNIASELHALRVEGWEISLTELSREQEDDEEPEK